MRQWNGHKVACEDRIQELFNQIEPHWNRLPEVDQDYMDAFFDVNRGSGEAAIRAVRWPRTICEGKAKENSMKPSWNAFSNCAAPACQHS